MRAFLAIIHLFLIYGLSLNAIAAQSNFEIPIATRVTVNYTAEENLSNIDLKLIDYDQSTYSYWEPSPLVSITPNGLPPEQQPTLKTKIFYHYYGNIYYGVSKHCTEELLCDPNYQFTIELNEENCSVDKNQLNDGTVKHAITYSSKIIDGGKTVDCTINIAASPVSDVPPPPPPTTASMQITIANQIGLAPGTGEYTYQLENGKTQITQGSFNPPDLINVPVNTNPAPVVTTLSGLEPESSVYTGIITYEFDDRVDSQNNPTVLQITLDNTHSSNMNDWCTADILNGNSGDRFYYLESVTVTGTVEEASCAVSIGVDNPPLNYQFNQVYTLPTTGILQWEHLYINNQDYLIAGSSLLNMYDDTSPYNVNLFAITPSNYASLQLVDEANCYQNGSADYLINHPYGWKHFSINNIDRVMMMNKQGYLAPIGGDCESLSYKTKSPVYQWSATWNGNYGGFNTATNYYELTTDSPVMAEFYEVNNNGATNYYLAVAESYLANISVMSVYQWNGGGFTKMSPDLSALGTHAVTDITKFTDIITDQTYLIISQPDANVTIFKVDNSGNLIEPRTLQVSGVKSALVFTVNNQQFLILGYATAPTHPSIYQWQSATANFQAIQTLPSSFGAAQAWQLFTEDNLQFLVGAFGTGGAKAYYWSAQAQRLQTQNEYPVPLGDCVNNGNVVNLTAFEMNANNYVALACYEANGNSQVNSPVAIWQQAK